MKIEVNIIANSEEEKKVAINYCNLMFQGFNANLKQVIVDYNNPAENPSVDQQQAADIVIRATLR